ncbi:MAG: hypothetical protein HN576_16145 [Bacteriovoracaceae bacterium]|jgi:dTDP-4-dehydrorhamnose reductase|nr:hypothetical protein [Bacteriovoracaceae bacterium]
MTSEKKYDYIVLGSNGLVGDGAISRFKNSKATVLGINRDNYEGLIGSRCRTFINCNGNSYRFKANQDPKFDWMASVNSVENTFFDFEFDHYVYMSTIDVYNDVSNFEKTLEESTINPKDLNYYSFHKWIAERLVEKYCDNYLILRLGTVVGDKLKKGPIYDLLNTGTVFMSLDSNLSLIDTNQIANFLETYSFERHSEIFNLTGGGPVRLWDLVDELGIEVKFGCDGEPKKYNYMINNEKVKNVLDIPTSKKIGIDYLKRKG